MNKLFLLTCVAAVTTAAYSIPLASQEIVVNPVDDETSAFVASVSADLDRILARVWVPPSIEPRGIVRVRFEADGNGRPANVRLYSRSGNSLTDHTALKAVQRLGAHDPLPTALIAGREIQANIIFAGSQSDLKRYTERLAKEEAARLSAGREEREVFALTFTRNPRS